MNLEFLEIASLCSLAMTKILEFLRLKIPPNPKNANIKQKLEFHIEILGSSWGMT